jgi:hypothetical protein
MYKFKLISPAQKERGFGDRRGDPLGVCGGWFRVEKKFSPRLLENGSSVGLISMNTTGLLGSVPVLWLRTKEPDTVSANLIFEGGGGGGLLVEGKESLLERELSVSHEKY